MNFQTIVHDGFFKNPDKVREWGLTLEYRHTDGTFPGVRTQNLKYEHKKFYEATASKLLALWGNYDRNDWECQLQFQKIKRCTDDPALNTGWIHMDRGVQAAAVIYMDPNSNLDHGTSIYRMNEGCEENAKEWQKKHATADETNFYHKVLGAKQSRDPEDLKIFKANMKINNDMFTRTMEVKNVYNRVIGYDGNQWHGQSNFLMDNDDDFRLTIVAFITNCTKPATRRFSLKSRYI